MKIIAIAIPSSAIEPIEFILQSLPQNYPNPIIIIQHALPKTIENLIHYLKPITPINLQIAHSGIKPKPGHVYFASSHQHLILNNSGLFEYTDHPKDVIFKPSIDIFFKSLAKNSPNPGIAFLFPDPSEDGFEGLISLNKNHWLTIGVLYDNNTDLVRTSLAQSNIKKIYILPDIPSILLENSPKLAYLGKTPLD